MGLVGGGRQILHPNYPTKKTFIKNA